MPARILIVEDERITAENLRNILTELGYVVTGVLSTGADAIGCTSDDAPDLVLMDIKINGEMDGAEAAQILRKRFNIPVIYLTAQADLATMERAKLHDFGRSVVRIGNHPLFRISMPPTICRAPGSTGTLAEPLGWI